MQYNKVSYRMGCNIYIYIYIYMFEFKFGKDGGKIRDYY